jgi:hypothetical protein
MANEFDGLRERRRSAKTRQTKNRDGPNAPRGGVHLFLPPGPVTHHSPTLVARSLMAVNRKLPKDW